MTPDTTGIPARNAATAPAGGAAATAGPRCLGLALLVISMAQLMLVLDELIVNTALPHIQQALRPSGERSSLTDHTRNISSPRQSHHPQRARIRHRRRQPRNRRRPDRRLDDRLLDPEQPAHRRMHGQQPDLATSKGVSLP